MPALLIKDVPPVLHHRLKEEAEKHHRSMTKQALAILEQGLGVASARSLRDVRPVACRIRITDAWILRARDWGRT